MSGTFTHPCLWEYLRACEPCGFFFFLYSAITSALENTDLEQRALCKYFRFIRMKIPEISVGSQMERLVSVCSDRNIRDHLLIGRTENYRSILLNRLISRFPSVDFSYNGNWGNPYQIKKQKKVRVIQLSVGPVRSENVVAVPTGL